MSIFIKTAGGYQPIDGTGVSAPTKRTIPWSALEANYGGYLASTPEDRAEIMLGRVTYEAEDLSVRTEAYAKAEWRRFEAFNA